MKKNCILFAIVCIFSSFAASKSSGQDLSTIKKEIEKDNILYFDLFKKNDAAIVNLYTADACLMPPNTPVIRGRAALIKDFKDTYAGGKIKGVKFSTVDVYGDGILYVTEEGTWQVLDTDNKVIDKGKYLKLWKKTTLGWKIFRDVFNSNQKGS
jgi:ketosteroid isomerase-like protein